MHRIAFAIASILSIFIPSPASAQVVITQAKALAGGVTPGDTAGYPITLSQPGAYVLGSNLTVPSGIYGIYAGVDNIDIDLNGFTISGGGVATYALISSRGESRIHGGVIKQFRSSGLYLRNNAWVVSDMQIVRNGGAGIDAVGARYMKVQDTLVAANAGSGIFVGDDASILHSVAANNGLNGIFCGRYCEISTSTVSTNSQHGIYISSGLIIGSTISENGFFGGINTIYYGVYTDGFGPGMSNNMIIDNNSRVPTQTWGVWQIGANGCVGNKPCFPTP